MARRLTITFSILAAAALTAGSALAQGARPQPQQAPRLQPEGRAVTNASALLASQIQAAVNNLPAGSSPDDVRAAIATVVKNSGASPATAVAALSIVKQNNMTNPTVFQAAGTVSTVVTVLASTGGSLQTLSAQQINSASQVVTNTQTSILIQTGSSSSGSSSFSQGSATNDTASTTVGVGAPPSNNNSQGSGSDYHG
jgi:hypothetical protein